MNFLIALVSIIMVVYGIITTINPDKVLRFGDRFKIRGDVEYTDFAIAMARLGGVLMVIMGIVAFFLSFTLGAY